MPKKKVHLLALHAGYVETAYTGTVLVYNDEGFKTFDEAVADFLAAFREGCDSYRADAQQNVEFCEREVARFPSKLSRAQLLQAQQDASASNSDLAYRYSVSNNQDEITHHVWEALAGRGWNLALDSYDTKPVKLPTVYGVKDWPRLLENDPIDDEDE